MYLSLDIGEIVCTTKGNKGIKKAKTVEPVPEPAESYYR